MKKIIIIGLMVVATIQTQAQSIQKSVIGSAGNVSTNGNVTLRNTIGETLVTTVGNGSIKISQGFQYNKIINNPLPITGFDFFAKRTSPSNVSLNWETLTELNNKGFYVERKLENEQEFASLYFLTSKADKGNSEFKLTYQYQDDNNYAGNTYYRLKQEDIDGKYSYSIVRVVHGETASKLSMRVWPIPASSYLNIKIDGVAKPETIDLIDMNGKILNVYTVYNQQELKIELASMSAGIYFLKLKSDATLIQKFIVQ